MKKNKFINEDLKSLQDLQEKYQMKKKDIFDSLKLAIDDRETEEIRNLGKEFGEIENYLDEIKKQITQLKELEEKEEER